MSIAVVTGSGGLIGSEAARFFAEGGLEVVGIDNDLRRYFFGEQASTRWNRDRLQQQLGQNYTHVDLDIRDEGGVDRLFARYQAAIKLVLHTAAQPSHDWAALEPHTDLGVKALTILLYISREPSHAELGTDIYDINKKHVDRNSQEVRQRTPWLEDPDRSAHL